MSTRCSSRAVLAVAGLLISVVWSGNASAQVGTGTLTGKVQDASNEAAVADVVVTVTSPALQGEEIVITSASGEYRVGGLPPGDYTIRMDKETYRPFSRAGIRVRGDVTLRVDVGLLPESLKAEDIVVVGRRPTVDIGSSAVGSNIGTDFVRRMPIIRPGGKGAESRSIESAAASAPQASSDTYGTSINGTTSPENHYLIDGLSVGDPGYGTLGTPLSMEFVKELNIITGGFMPEYGKATGGILNAITQSGSNEFKAEFWGYLSPGALEGPQTKVKRQGDTIDTQVHLGDIYDFGASVGGPILKDKLWFYFGVDYSTIRWNLDRSLRKISYDPTTFEPLVDTDGLTVTTLIPGTAKTYVAASRTLQLFGKLDYRLDDANRLALTIVGAPRWSGGGGDYGIDPRDGSPEATALIGTYDRLAHVYDGGAIDLVLKWTSDLVGKKLLLDTSVGWHHQTGGRGPSDGSAIGGSSGLAGEVGIIWRRTKDPALRITDFPGELSNSSLCDPPAGAPDGLSPCPLQSYNNGGPGFIDHEAMNRFGFDTVLTWLPELLGTHVVKVGFGIDYMDYQHKRGYSGGTLYRQATSGGSWTDIRQYGFLSGPDDFHILPALDYGVKSVSFGGFIQDSWSFIKGLSLDFGVRYDAQYVYGGEGQLALSLPNQWSPRVGLIWDPSGKGDAKLFTNLALFYESVPLDIADRAGSGEPQIASIKPASACDPSDPAQAKGSCLDDDNRFVVQGPSSPDTKWILTGGGLTPVDPNLSPQSSWEFVLGGEYDLGAAVDALRDLRAGLVYTRRWMNNVIEDMSNDEAQTYFIGNPGHGIASGFPEATRDYDAVTLYFMKEFSSSWMAQASYTLSWLRGNYAGLFRPETGQLDPNINSDFDLASLTVNKKGPLPGDSRHVIKLFVANDIKLGESHHIQPGLALRTSSGGPTNYLGSHPIYGGDEVMVLPRGSGDQLPWVTSIDFHLAYELKLTDNYSLSFIVDIFNLFDFQAVTGRSQRYTNADVNPIEGGTKDSLGDLKYSDGTAFDPADINPNFGNPTSYQRPRTFRFGIRGSL